MELAVAHAEATRSMATALKDTPEVKGIDGWEEEEEESALSNARMMQETQRSQKERLPSGSPYFRKSHGWLLLPHQSLVEGRTGSDSNSEDARLRQDQAKQRLQQQEMVAEQEPNLAPPSMYMHR